MNMFSLNGHVIDWVFASVLVIMMGTGFLVTVAVTRRKSREKYFRRIDDLRDRYSPLVAALLAGDVKFEHGRDALNAISGIDRLDVLERLLLGAERIPAHLPLLQKLCIELGLVKVWQSQLTGEPNLRSMGSARGSRARRVGRFRLMLRVAGAGLFREDFGFVKICPDDQKGRRNRASGRPTRARQHGAFRGRGRPGFVVRATSALHLGAIGHRPSWPLLVIALDDVNADVGAVAARSLAAMGGEDSFRALLDRLYALSQQPSPLLSVRSIHMALATFPVAYAVQLLPWLEHSQGEIRFLAVDIIRVMAEQRAREIGDYTLSTTEFGPQLTDIFLRRLCRDEVPNVRALAASIIARLVDPRTASALCALLEDPAWFVRLRAMRALAKPKYASSAALIAKGLADPHWRVREAAAQTLLAFGAAGREELFDHFLTTRDHYSQEQIAEEIQRARLMPSLLTAYASNRNCQEAQVLDQLVSMGKTSDLVKLLENSPNFALQSKALTSFVRYSDPQIRAWMANLGHLGLNLPPRPSDKGPERDPAPTKGL